MLLRRPESGNSPIANACPRVNGPVCLYGPRAGSFRGVPLFDVRGRLRSLAGRGYPTRVDPITHTMTGATLAATGLRRATPLAAGTLMLAANAPDIDILIYITGNEYDGLAFRRGWTHGPLALAALPFAVTGLALAWDRWVRRRRDPRATPARAGPLLLLAVLGVLTHPLLDWLNNYGIRLLMPFGERWFYGDAVFIVDPWLWLALGGALFLVHSRDGPSIAGWALFAALAGFLVLGTPMVPAPAKLVWAALLIAVIALRVAGVADRRGVGPERVARWGGALALGFILLLILADFVEVRDVRAAVAGRGGGPVEAVMVAPVPANPFGGSVVVATPTAYLFGTYDWLARPRVRIGEDSLPRRPADAVTEAAARDPDAAAYLTWARFPYYEVEPRPGGYTVFIGDARYRGHLGSGSMSGVTVQLDSALAPVP